MTAKDRIKASARRVPLLQRIAARFAAHDAQLEHHERRLDDLLNAVQPMQAALPNIQFRLELIEQHLPGLLNTISSSHGAQRAAKRTIAEQQQRIDQLTEALELHVASLGEQWGRLEMIRREVMFELRYGQRGEADEPEVRIVDPERFDDARREGLRLNLGCGHLPIEGYINVDGRELPGVDVVAPVDRLPVDPGEVAEIFSAHLVEHFPQEELVRRILPYWVDLLRPGGELRAVVPDAGAMLAGHADGEVPYDDLREVLYGGQEYEGDFHFNMYTTESLTQLFEDAGLVDCEVEAAGRRNGACLEFQLVGRRPLQR